MDLEISKSEDTVVLKLKGSWTIEHAGRLKASLQEVLAGNARIVIDLEELTDTDLCSLQLLCSAHQASVRLGKEMTLHERKPEPLRRIVRDAGLARTIGCNKNPDKNCLWMGDWL